jgi:exopolysaccharide production protein ExoZ
MTHRQKLHSQYYGPSGKVYSTPSNTLFGIQILRGIAATGVVVHHALEESQVFESFQHLPKFWILIGASGVDLFFVISGFIMFYTSYEKFGKANAASNFLIRRIIRIVPTYWLCSLFLLFLTATGVFYTHHPVSLSSVVSSLLFFPTLNPILGVGWTLNYEMYFYLIFAAFLGLSKRITAFYGISATLLLIILISSAIPDEAIREFFQNPISIEFCFGMLIGLLFCTFSSNLGNFGIVALFGIIGLVVGTALGPTDGTTGGLSPHIRFLSWGAPAALVVYSALGIRLVHSGLEKSLLFLGDASYSIYLTHGFVMVSYAKLIKNETIRECIPSIVWMGAVIAASLLLGFLTYRFVERPIDMFLRKHVSYIAAK